MRYNGSTNCFRGISKSLKTGMRGWSDYEQDMIDANGEFVDEDSAIEYFTPRLKPEQISKTA